MNIVVFSKDRGCQLELFLRSMILCFEQFGESKIKIIFKATTENFKKGYDRTRKIIDESNISWVEEGDFKKDVLSSVSSSEEFTVFFTDDDIWINYFSLDNPNYVNFTKDMSVLCFSLRLNKSLSYCYASNSTISKIPVFDKFNTFSFFGSQGDYGYPMSLDGHVFRTEDVYPLLSRLEYKNPNSLEYELSKNVINKSKMACCENSIIINNPCSIVQDFCPNRNEGLSHSVINEKYLDGFSISLDGIVGLKNVSVHVPITPVLKKFVSVIIPSYNRYELLMNAIKSVKKQTCKNFEIIVINDKSTDIRYGETDWRSLGVRYFVTKDGCGVCVARNLAIAKSRYDLVAFLDDDDSWMTEKLEKQIEAMGNNKMSCTEGYYSSDEVVFRRSGKYLTYFGEKYKNYIKNAIGLDVIPDIIKKDMMVKHNIMATSSVMVCKDLLQKYDGFKADKSLRCEDWPLWNRCLGETDCRYVNLPLFFYNNTKRQRVALKRGLTWA